MYFIGFAAFLLCFLHDCNDWKFGKKWLRFCFPTGIALIVISTIWMCLEPDTVYIDVIWIRIAAGALGLFMVWAEVYSLFFSFDRKEAYVNNCNRGTGTVYTAGMYALCRHPGVLFFVLLYVNIWLCLGMDLKGMLMLCTLNVLLAVFEDFVVFPESLGGYREYRKTTPFIIPNTASVKRCIEDFRRN